MHVFGFRLRVGFESDLESESNLKSDLEPELELDLDLDLKAQNCNHPYTPERLLKLFDIDECNEVASQVAAVCPVLVQDSQCLFAQFDLLVPGGDCQIAYLVPYWLGFGIIHWSAHWGTEYVCLM